MELISEKKSKEGKYREQQEIAIDSTEHTVRTTDEKLNTEKYYQAT